jgi:hypothetical protein
MGRFISHAHLGLSKNISEHRINLCERLGNTILWTAESLPRMVWNTLKLPQVATVALTSLALLTNSFFFYPIISWLKVKSFIHVLPLPPFWAVRLTSYIFTSALIVGYGLRAFGRFTNTELMQKFYYSESASAQ